MVIDMRKTTLEIKKNYEKAGIVSAEDIEKICVLEEQYAEECEKIAEMCEEEGYPAHGSNYDLRCESVREYYDAKIDEILDEYYTE